MMTHAMRLEIIFRILDEHGMLASSADQTYDTAAWNACYAAILAALEQSSKAET